MTLNFLTRARRSPILTSWPIVLAGVLSLIAYGGMVGLHLRHGTLREAVTPQTLARYGLAFMAYLVALLWIEHRRGLSLKLIFAGAIIFRGLLLFTTPTLSDDVYRYMWDGYVANNGVSPYAQPIESPRLDYLDTPQRALANNAWMASPYLPAAQYLFAGLTLITPASPLIFQVAMVMLDIVNGLWLVNLLRLAGLPAYRVFIYLWNPLIVVEVAHGAHIDTWMIFLLLPALWLILQPRAASAFNFLGPFVLALATLTKGLPLLLLAVLFWRWRWWQMGLYGAVVIGLLIPAGLTAGWGLTGPLDGSGLFGALRIYASYWNFNSGLFHWIKVGLMDWGLVAATVWAKGIVGLLLLATLGWVWLRARRIENPRPALRLMVVPLMAHLLLATTVHPWYLMTLLAFLPFLAPGPGRASAESPWRWLTLAPWLYLSWSLSLSYLTYLDPVDFRELAWVRQAEWLPTLLLLGPAVVVMARWCGWGSES